MNPTDKKYRSWCGVYQFKGKKKFMVGTCVLPYEISDHELTAALDKEFAKVFDEIFPDHFERPPLVNYIPGAILFVDEREMT